MNKKDVLIGIIFFIVGITSRYPLVEKYQSFWDGPQYSIGIVRYSLEQQTPAPPGYPIYILVLGRLFNYFIHDPFHSLIFISIVFSGLGACMLYIAGKEIFNRQVGIIASCLYLSGPTFYFLGITAYPYGMIPGTITSLALCAWLISAKRRNIGVLLGALFAIIIGIRPQEFLIFFPLYLLGVIYLSTREKIKSLLSFVTVFLLWFVPFMYVVGGIEDYINTLYFSIKNGVIDSISVDNSFKYFLRVGKGFFLSFTASSFFLIQFLFQFKNMKKKNLFKNLYNKKTQLFLFWITPSLASNLFIRNDNACYQMTYLSGFVLLISYCMWLTLKKNKIHLFIILLLIICFNLWWFFRDRDPYFLKPYVPTSFHYSEIRKNDIKMGVKVSFIKKNYSPNNTAIVTSSLYWRPVMYYFPQFLVYSPSGVDTTDKMFKHVFREGKGWDMKEYDNYSNTIIFPINIRNIVFFNDEAQNWVQNSSKKVYILEGNSSITVMSVSEGVRIVYGFNSIKL